MIRVYFEEVLREKDCGFESEEWFGPQAMGK